MNPIKKIYSIVMTFVISSSIALASEITLASKVARRRSGTSAEAVAGR
jgi:hypothetical protein